VRILSRAIFLSVAAVVVLFSVSNRETVSVAFWPLPFVADVPLYLLCLLSLLIGGLIGAGIAWTAGRRYRRGLRSLRRRIAALERELTATQSRLEDHPSTSTALPAARQLRRFSREGAAGAPQR
jgi:uncharacterized integral membrane protein